MFYHFFFRSSSAYICQDPGIARQDPRIARAYTAQNTKNAHFSLVSLSPRTRSRPGPERIRQGEGRLSRPPRTALERSYFTENSSSENRILRPRRKKLLTESPAKRMIIYIFIYIFSHFYFTASGQAVVTGVVPSFPRFLPSIFIAHRVQQSHCSSSFHRVLLTHALALSASQFVHKKKSQGIYTIRRACARWGSNSRN